jgi:8-oxo-dGTP diphosphatase
MSNNNFIIRVYGIYIDERNRLLVSDEIVKGKYVTKFPGGGLEYGEGTIDCLKREMREEMNSEFEILSHYYTTDFFLESAFHPDHQIISIYYLMNPVNGLSLKIASQPFEFATEDEGEQSLRFIDLKDIEVDHFSFEIDRYVVKRLLKIV